MQGFVSPMEILVWVAIVIELFEAAMADGQGGYWADVSVLLILQVQAAGSQALCFAELPCDSREYPPALGVYTSHAMLCVYLG